MSGPLTPDQASAVLRRAAALDADPLDDHLDEDVLRAAAREVGLSEEAVEQAVVELRSGQLAPLPALAPARRLGLTAQVVVERTLALDPATATEAVEAWLRGQWFEPRRAYGTTRDWEPRRGKLARARRLADVQKRLRLDDASRLRVQVAAAPSGGSRVQVIAELDDLRRGLITGGVVTPGALGVGGGLALGALGGLEIVEAALALGAGGVLSGGGWTLSRRTLDARRTRLSEDVALAVDGLRPVPPAVARPLPTWVPPGLTKWADRFKR